MMYGINELKEQIAITDNSVECPVKGCNYIVKRQRQGDLRPKCPEHDIFISPTSFSYPNETDNLVWVDHSDIEMLNKIKKVKRESRIQENNSEDAVTWNVFRFMERNNLSSHFLKHFFKIEEPYPQIIYWSYSPIENNVWQYLMSGREQFELNPARGSEPDIIIVGDQNIIFIEAKLSSKNITEPKNLKVEKKYTSGGNGWWQKVFNDDFTTVAVTEKKYELARFWLIGSWISNIQNKSFYLVNLTLDRKSKDIESKFKNYIKEDVSKIFKRLRWEDIANFISRADINVNTKEREIILSYFRNKTLGYKNGKLEKAFDI